MSEILLESDYLLVNLNSFAKPANAPADSAVAGGDGGETSATADTETTANPAKPKVKVDWAKELDQRIADNKKLSPDARMQEAELRAKFWKDFFSAEFVDTAIVEALLQITKLKDDIKVLGFTKKSNPILAFLHLKHIQNNVIKPGLLGANTYIAIRNALAKKQLATSELRKENNYNIIYCVDLYKKLPADIKAYLEAQSKILLPNATIYTEKIQNLNKQIFLQPRNQKTMKSAAAKLNSISTVNKTLVKAGILGAKEVGDSSDSSENSTENTSATKLSYKLDTREKVLAAMQYIAANANSTSMYKALNSAINDGNVPNVDMLISASKSIAPLLASLSITKSDLDDLAKELLAKYKNLK